MSAEPQLNPTSWRLEDEASLRCEVVPERDAVRVPPIGGSMLRVVLIDDVKQVRQAVARLIRNAGHGIVGEAADGASGVRETLGQRPDLVVIDGRMPGMDGVEATRRIRACYPAAAIVAFCSTDSPELRDAFLSAGAEAFVDKRDVSGLIAAVRAVAEAKSSSG
jgi:DNA-binding NarL/FixJ family response regulator